MNTKRKKEERNLSVLAQIVRLYVVSASPVSSKSVARSMEDSLSSATIRNVMGELEELGCIEQPHTSAGRVPTDEGYRCYVNFVKKKIQFEKRKAEHLQREYLERIRSIKDVIKITSFLISRELQNAGIVMWPNVGNLYLKHIELVKVKAEAALAVLVTMTNAVKNYIIKLDRKLDDARLEHIANYINANYWDSAVSQIAADLKRTMRDKDEDNKDIIELSKNALNVIDAIIEQDLDNDIYWDGLEYFVNEPEFRDLDVTRRFFQIFSDKKDLISLMQNELPFRDIRIYIGKENECDRFRDCSIITSGYELQGRTIGRFGVIGPKRMDYDNALRTLGCLSDLISEKLEEINRAE
ncbi:MAG: heat-inducible transcriptional repressor HrcA [Candidatus Omnitrophota bacterium]